MKTKKLPTTFRRGDFDWELIERKTRTIHQDGKGWFEREFGLYKQDSRHWVVCRIMDREPHPDSPTEFDLIEKIPTDRMWGELANTYDTLEEAKKEYESK